MNHNSTIQRMVVAVLPLTMLLASGCGVYTRYERPENMPYLEQAQTTVADSLRFDTLSVVSLSWRDLFTDEHLCKLIEEGLAGNTDLAIARQKIIEAEATLQASKMAFLPSASLSAQAGVNGKGDDEVSSITIQPSVNCEIDIFGNKRNAKEAARASLEYSKAYAQGVQSAFIATIAESYYTLLALDEQIDICHRTLGTWNENIRTLEALKQAGKTNEASVLHAKANRLKVESSMLSMEKQIIIQENSLMALVGSMPRVVERGKLSEQIFPNALVAEVPLYLLSRRPDVRQAEFNLMEAFYLTNQARSMFYPSLTLRGVVGWSNSSGGSIESPSSWLFNAIGELVQPLFSRGTNKARLKSAKARQEQAVLNFKQVLLDAGVEANNALVSWQTARKRLDVDAKLVLTLQAAVWNTKLLMKHGGANYLEVLTAQQNLLQAELTQSDDRYSEISSVIAFFKSLGGGVE